MLGSVRLFSLRAHELVVFLWLPFATYQARIMRDTAKDTARLSVF